MAGYVSPERKALQTKANIFIVLGLVLSFGTRLIGSLLLNTSDTGTSGLGIVAILFLIVGGIAGLICWFIGLSAYAQSKGYSSWYSLFGLLSCCGLLVLVILPNKWVDSGPSGYGPGDYPRPNG